MNLVARRFLYLGAFALFTALAPIVIRVARGDRFDLRTFHWMSSGGLVVASDPNGAHILIDGRVRSGLTPHSYRSLAPGSYELAIDRSTTMPWQMRIAIQVRQTLQIYATLLPRTPASTSVIASDVVSATSDPRGQRIVLLRSVALNRYAVDRYDRSGSLLHRLAIVEAASPPDVSWSIHGKYIALINDQGPLFVIEAASGQLLRVPAPFDGADRIAWDQASETVLYLLRRGTVWSIDFRNASITSLASPNVLDAAICNQSLMLLRTSAGGEVQLDRRTTPFGTASTGSLTVAMIGARRILGCGRSTIVASDEAVAAIDERGTVAATMATSNVRSISWSLGRSFAIITTPTEVWSYDARTDQFRLEARYTDVKAVAWHPRRPVVLIWSDDQTSVLDLEARSARSGVPPALTATRAVFPIDDTHLGLIVDRGIVELEL